MTYKPPKGLCDMCGKRKATHWFGRTSVALCDDETCAQKNHAKWEMQKEEEEGDWTGW